MPSRSPSTRSPGITVTSPIRTGTFIPVSITSPIGGRISVLGNRQACPYFGNSVQIADAAVDD